MGEPSATSAALVDSATAASTPERIDTGNWRLLLEVTRSLLALARACTVKTAADVLRAMTETLALASVAMAPSEHVAVSPDTEQLPSELVADSMVNAGLLGKVM